MILCSQGNLRVMQKFNILKKLYRQSPMDFYTKNQDSTIIKSINNTSLGYKFDKLFSEEEIHSVWQQIRVHKRFSVIFIFILFIILLYEFIFPKFSFFINNNWYINAIIILAIISVVSYTMTLICTKFFEKKLKKEFGNFEKTTFYPSKEVDKKYYEIFKTELIKLLIALILLISSCTFFSPFEFTQKLLEKERFKEVIKITTVGSKVFPIAPHWYSIRGYAYFQIDEYEKAIEDFDKAYKLEADGFNVMNFDNKIFVRYHMKDYDTAIKDFDTEIQNANNDNERDQFLWDKAQFLYNIKHYDEALELYNDLIIKAENDRIFLLKDRLYMERAQVYKKLGKKDLAQADIETANAEEVDVNKNYIPKPMLMLDEETFYSY